MLWLRLTGTGKHYNPRLDDKIRAFRPQTASKWLLLLPALPAFLALAGLAVVPGERPAQVSVTLSANDLLQPAAANPDALAGAAVEPDQANEPARADPYWRDYLVRKGDSLARIFKRHGISMASLHELIRQTEGTEELRLLKPGERLSLAMEEGQLVGLLYEMNPLHQLYVSRPRQKMVARTVEHEPDREQRYTQGTIDSEASSLYLAGQRAGLSDRLIHELDSIFQWDISFALELRPGDYFELLYEELWRDGKYIGDGDLLAARFVNMKEEHVAVRYTDQTGQTGYYTPSGHSLKKLFLRDPVHFSRISSHFNLSRLHPIHNRIMPHRGIDYAADKGSPVMASGDGLVTVADYNDASGNYLILEHGSQYTTKYLHLSGFAKGVGRGKRVKQGQVIGYVGATGWATGPHLHYEFLINGIHRNPSTLNLPQAKPVESDEMPRFKVRAEHLLSDLKSGPETGGGTLAGGG